MALFLKSIFKTNLFFGTYSLFRGQLRLIPDLQDQIPILSAIILQVVMVLSPILTNKLELWRKK